MVVVRAQRLSASQRWACGHRGPGKARAGVDVLNAFRHHRGGHASSWKPSGFACDVLNAFRHHRGGHAEDDSHGGAGICAQRLSASQRWAYHHGRVNQRGLTRAQRLSASQRWAYRDRRCQAAQPGKCSTPFGIIEVGIGFQFKFTRGVVATKCSTPFGITEVGISVVSVASDRDIVCSTPFGITEVGMRFARGAWSCCLSAQRLSASQRWACRGALGVPGWASRVLNAFRHHRGGHMPSWHPAHRGLPVLNAFRHHRGGHDTDPLRHRHDRASVLNAFRHHRGGHVSQFR